MIVRSFLLSSLLLLSCANQPPSRSETPQGHNHLDLAMVAMDCPMQLPGTQVTAEDVQGGVAIRFTTNGDVEVLRRRVQLMSAKHEEQQAEAARKRKRGGSAESMVLHHTHALPIAGGAELVMSPEHPAELERLRQQVRNHAEEMAASCPVRQGPNYQTPG